MKFAICNEIFKDWKLDDAMDFAARVGYDAIELAPFTLAPLVSQISSTERERIRGLDRGAGIGICGLHWVLVQAEGMYLNHNDPTVRHRTAKYLCDLVDFCADVGGRTVVVGSPKQRNLLPGISAAQASSGMSIWSILIFPALFTAGMSLIDTTDSILMLGAYGWAFIKPIRKLYYNMTITFVSVVVALLVGSIEALGLLADQMHLTGRFWNAMGSLNDNFGTIGFFIIGVFVLSWVLSLVFYKWRGFDDLELKP